MKKFFVFTIAFALWATATTTSHAQVMQNNSEAASFTVADDDLLQTAFGSVVSSNLSDRTGNATDTAFLAGFTPNGEASLRDGVFQDVGTQGRAAALVENDEFIEYTFDLSSASSGFDITGIDLYTNWGTGNGRDEVNTNISLSFVDDPTAFTQLGSGPFVFNPPVQTQALVSIVDGSGVLASGVAGIRFDFPDGQENNAVGYSEIDVFGVASTAAQVPEPGALSAVLIGGIGVLMRRRKKA